MWLQASVAGEKRQRTAALQDAGATHYAVGLLGVAALGGGRLSSIAVLRRGKGFFDREIRGIRERGRRWLTGEWDGWDGCDEWGWVARSTIVGSAVKAEG